METVSGISQQQEGDAKSHLVKQYRNETWKTNGITLATKLRCAEVPFMNGGG